MDWRRGAFAFVWPRFSYITDDISHDTHDETPVSHETPQDMPVKATADADFMSTTDEDAAQLSIEAVARSLVPVVCPSVVAGTHEDIETHDNTQTHHETATHSNCTLANEIVSITQDAAVVVEETAHVINATTLAEETQPNDDEGVRVELFSAALDHDEPAALRPRGRVIEIPVQSTRYLETMRRRRINHVFWNQAETQRDTATRHAHTMHRDNETQRRQQDTQRRENETRGRVRETHRQGEETRRREKETRRREKETQPRVEETRERGGWTSSREVRLRELRGLLSREFALPKSGESKCPLGEILEIPDLDWRQRRRCLNKFRTPRFLTQAEWLGICEYADLMDHTRKNRSDLVGHTRSRWRLGGTSQETVMSVEHVDSANFVQHVINTYKNYTNHRPMEDWKKLALRQLHKKGANPDAIFKSFYTLYAQAY